MGTVKAVCTSTIKGIQKSEAHSIELRPDWGIQDDAHAGHWHRQVSLLSYEKIEDFKNLPIGTRFRSGNVVLELTQIGKECHAHCAIYHKMGDCIMPREGVFCKVIEGGRIAPGDSIEVIEGIEKTRRMAGVQQCM